MHTHQFSGTGFVRDCLGLCAIATFTLAMPCLALSQTPPVAPPSPAVAGSSPSAIARAQADSARYPYTAADISFMTGMIGHHAQAILMSQLAPTHNASASVQTLAARIINSQQDEISIMARWLRDRRQPVPDTTVHPGSMMMMDGHAMNMSSDMPLMPGMLTNAQITALGNAQGTVFDSLFLTGMIQHHSGAVSMVQKLFATDGAAQDETVFKFASDVNVDQTTEIARMQRMLFMLKLQGKAP